MLAAGSFLSWIGHTYYYRFRVPKISLALRAQHGILNGRYILYVIADIHNLDWVKVTGDYCTLVARACRGSEIEENGGASVHVVPPAREALPHADEGMWKIPESDVARVWELDKGECNTFSFIVDFAAAAGPPFACYLQVDFRSKHRTLGSKAYTWRRDELYVFGPASGGLPQHEHGTENSERDTGNLKR